jgi:hypothetical protein
VADVTGEITRDGGPDAGRDSGRADPQRDERWLMPPRIAAVAMVLLAVVAVFTGWSIYQAIAGGDGGPPGGLPSSTVTGSSTGPSTGTAGTSASGTGTPTLKPPLLPAAAAKPTRDGAQAFFEHFVRTYSYTYNSLDTRPLKAISASACKYCQGVMDNVQKARAAGNSFESSPIKIVAIVTAPLLAPEDGTVVSVLIDQGPVIIKGSDGEVIQTSPGSNGARLDALVVWAGDKWVTRGVDIVAKGTP